MIRIMTLNLETRMKVSCVPEQCHTLVRQQHQVRNIRIQSAAPRCCNSLNYWLTLQRITKCYNSLTSSVPDQLSNCSVGWV